MTFNIHIWHVGSTSPYLVQVRRARPQVKIHSLTMKIFFFFDQWCTLQHDVFWLFVEFFVPQWSVLPRVRTFQLCYNLKHIHEGECQKSTVLLINVREKIPDPVWMQIWIWVQQFADHPRLQSSVPCTNAHPFQKCKSPFTISAYSWWDADRKTNWTITRFFSSFKPSKTVQNTSSRWFYSFYIDHSIVSISCMDS